MIIIKKLSEVCKIVGVTRRTLQEYDRIELFKPTKKDSNGYWYYDETAILNLMMIQIFVEGGYERKKIKDIIALDYENMLGEYDVLRGVLEEKKKRIDGMIKNLDVIKQTAGLPESFLKAFIVSGIIKTYENKSFIKTWNENAELLAKLNIEEVNKDDFDKYAPLATMIYLIGYQKEKGVDNANVQECVKKLVEYTYNLMLNEEIFEMSIEEENYLNDIMDFLVELVSEEEFAIEMNKQCGSETSEYVINAFKCFSESKCNG